MTRYHSSTLYNGVCDQMLAPIFKINIWDLQIHTDGNILFCLFKCHKFYCCCGIIAERFLVSAEHNKVQSSFDLHCRPRPGKWYKFKPIGNMVLIQIHTHTHTHTHICVCMSNLTWRQLWRVVKWFIVLYINININVSVINLYRTLI